MKRSKNGKITLTNFLSTVSNVLMVVGFFALFGAVGALDYNAATGLPDTMGQLLLFPAAVVCMGVGFCVRNFSKQG